MTGTKDSPLLSMTQRFLLLFVALLMAVLLFIFRGGINPEAPLDQLARRSIDPDLAFTNGRPTMVEFYANWCQACIEMAPAMLEVESISKSNFDIVMLNIENNQWSDLIDLYQVNGIPQLSLFDSRGDHLSDYVGLRSKTEIFQLAEALMNDDPLPKLVGIRISTNFYSPVQKKTEKEQRSNVENPLSHG